jgi:hypothetical protein
VIDVVEVHGVGTEVVEHRLDAVSRRRRVHHAADGEDLRHR